MDAPTHQDSTPRIRTAMLCVDQGRLLCVELRDPTTRKRFWSLPGGEIEAGESALHAAVRETKEETGYDVDADPASEQTTHYLFRWNARCYECETHWFKGTLAGDRPATVDDADFLLGCRWIPLERVAQLLSPHPEIQQTALKLLGR